MEAKGNIELEIIRKFWFDEVRPPIMEALVKTPDDKLDWMPAEGMLSLGNIFMHIAEAGDWWIDKMIDGKDYEDIVPGPSYPKKDIEAMLNNHWKRLEHFYDRCPEIAERKIPHTRKGKKHMLTGGWIMMHLFEHDIHHRSQINQYLRILGIEPPKI